MPTNMRSNFPLIAAYICDEYERRKNDRKHIETEWTDIDRQLAMKPTLSHKMIGGQLDKRLAWMPEFELPLQSQTLEVIKADTKRFLLPSNGTWFAANAKMEDGYLDKYDLADFIDGDMNDVPSHLDQDNINKLAEGTILHWQRQYRFRNHLSMICSESIKYGMGVGRSRAVRKSLFLNTARGVSKNDKLIPVLFPISIKNTYLDTSSHYLMNEGQMSGPLTIFYKKQKVEDLRKASSVGSSDPNKTEGGWIPIGKLDGDKNGEIELLEAEGDLILPKKTSGFIHLPNAIITIVKGYKGEKPHQQVVRYRIRKQPYSTYIEFPYQPEHIDTPYSTSPLIKGRPIQIAAVEALTRTLISAQLHSLPPIQYDADDTTFGASGGPNIHPGAAIPSLGDIKSIMAGDPQKLMNIYLSLLQQYADVTGVNAPRLGAQTVSHTTAFAKDAELNRGQIRTVDFAEDTLAGPLTQWLNNCYYIGREIQRPESVFIDAYGGFVKIDKDRLPKEVSFEAVGSTGPREEQARYQRKIESVQVSLSLDQLRAQAEQMGFKPTVNIEVAIKEILREGGWPDVDVITSGETVSQGPASQPDMAGNPGQAGGTAPGAAIQALAQNF